jgi:cell wall assembly regulator SMI1
VAETGAYADEDVAGAWARIEANLSRILPASLRQLASPAEVQAIDAVEAALAVVLPQDFRASLRIHNGTRWGQPGSGQPSPVPLDSLYDTNEIVEATRMWRDNYDADPVFDDPRVWAYLIDEGMLCLNGPVWPVVGAAGKMLAGTMNGDVYWFLDFDPAPGGTPGQVVRVDVECSSWDVLAPSWTQLLVRYAEDLELFGAAPDSSTLVIDQDLGPACEWGSTPTDSWGIRPAWLRDVQPRNPYPWER